jgi:propionyl-CoA carboxylase alpha chain
MFAKILIANRGEIACRIIKTAKRMGIKTVAVYSDADRDGLHVDLADEAVHIGPAPAAQSYLLADRIIDACRATGAEAVHPGYGFLSENAAFASACVEAGVVFIGPPPEAIVAMGDKITSKKIAAEAGVTTVPGSAGSIDNAKVAAGIAAEIGYPVMIKASAGGGGKGMRMAQSEGELAEGFDRARSEAVSSFGDDRIFIEKFIVDPRHIEIQILADSHGNVVHLGERECSIQRRHQKVIEEAPSPFLDARTRAAMGAQAVALSRAVGYQSAGTVEFIVDGERKFYFLEMNTRLQVEHPVTELVTGIDLVEQMLLVASGEKLSFQQDDVRLNGWAIEARVYAEDPYRGFLPSPGRLVRYRPPQELANKDLVVRNDGGVREGGQVAPYYDPMISKLCTWAPGRAAAIDAMADALDGFEVAGIGHNIPFLQAVMGQQRFRDGDLTTGYITDEFPDGFSGAQLDGSQRRLVIALAAALRQIEVKRRLPSRPQEGLWAVVDGDERADLSVTMEGAGGWSISGPGSGPGSDTQTMTIAWRPGDTIARVTDSGGGAHTIMVSATTTGYRLAYRGAVLDLKVVPPHIGDLMVHMQEKPEVDYSNFLMCPMPGQIVRLDVAEGDLVEAGQALVIVEAMKMENILRAYKSARVAKVNHAVGAVLAVDDIIIEFGDS